MATSAFVFVWLMTSAGGARAAAAGTPSFSTSGLIGAIVLTFISTLVAVTVVIFICLFLPRKHSRKKETHGSPSNETGVGSRIPLASNGRIIPPGSSDDVECGTRMHQDHVTVVPVDQIHAAAVISQRTLSKKRLNKVNSSPQKLNLEVKTNYSVNASVTDQKHRPEGEIGNNRKQVRPSVSYDGRFPLAYTCLEDEETSVTLVSRDPIGLGFNIYGNMTEGIFVREVLSRGPAAESGIISQGDRILSISISTAHMVLEDALTILSYASSYPVTLHISKSPGQEDLFTPASAQLPSDLEIIGASATDILRLRERGSSRPSVNPLYRSQSLDNLVDLKADADRSISEFRSSVDHLTRRFSEFRASPECLRRNIKKPSTVALLHHRWNFQLQQKLDLERLERTDVMESTPAGDGLALEGTRRAVYGEPSGPSYTTNCGDTVEENTKKIPPVDFGEPCGPNSITRPNYGDTSVENTETIAQVDFEQTMRSAVTLDNEKTPKEKVGEGAFLKNVSDLQDNRIRPTTTLVNRPTVSNNEEIDGFIISVSKEDTRIKIDDFDGHVTVRYNRDDVEIDNDKSHEVKNDFTASGVSMSPNLGVMDSSVSSARLDIERSDFEHSVLPGKNYAEEPSDEFQHSAVAESPNKYALNQQTCDSETKTLSESRSSVVRGESNPGVEDRIAEPLRNVAAAFESLDLNEKSYNAEGPGISGLKVLGGVENVAEIHESSRAKAIDQKDVTSAVEHSTVIRVNKDPSDIYSSSSEQTTIEVIESSQLQPTNDNSPSSKGFLKTMKKLFSFGQSKPAGDGETSMEEKTSNRTGKRGVRKSDKKFLASSSIGKTKGSNNSEGRIINGRDVTTVVHPETVRELSFDDVNDDVTDDVNDDDVFEEDIDKVIADFMGLSSQAGLQSEDREVSSQMESNHVTGDGITTDLKAAVPAMRTDDTTGAIDNPLELKSDIGQSSSQSRTETGIVDEAAGSEVTELDREVVGNCVRDQLDQGIVLENPYDITIYRQPEISCGSDRKEIANVFSTEESNSPIETSLELKDTDQISGRSVNDSSAETQNLEPMTENVESSSAHPNPLSQMTAISPVLKKFQTDMHNTKVIKPILKKLPSVSSSEINCALNTKDLLTKTPSNIPDDQVDVLRTNTASTSDQGHAKDIPNVIPKAVTTPDERRAILEAILGRAEGSDTEVTSSERTKATDSDRQVANKAETFREPLNHVTDSEAEESEAEMDMPWTAHEPPSYASHHEMVKTESGADDSWDSVPVPNYALFPDSFEAESEKEELWDSRPMTNYANYPEEIENESEKDVLYIDTVEPNRANYSRVTNFGFRRGERDTQPASQSRDYGDSILDTNSGGSVALREDNKDPEAPTIVSDYNNEPKTPVEVVKTLLEKLQSFGKRNSRDGANGNVVSDSSRVLGIRQPFALQGISSPFVVKKGDGSHENNYSECEEKEASGIDAAFKSKDALSNWRTSESNLDSDIVCEKEGEPVQLSERIEVFTRDDAGEKPMVVLYPTTTIVNGHDEFNSEDRYCTSKVVEDINNNNDSWRTEES